MTKTKPVHILIPLVDSTGLAPGLVGIIAMKARAQKKIEMDFDLCRVRILPNKKISPQKNI